MKKIINFLKKLFAKDSEIQTLFPKNKKVVLAEIGGNYCSDGC